MELSIDTSTKWTGLALSNQGNIIVEVNWYSEQNHSVELLPAIERIRIQFDVSLRDLTKIIVARGPGSFSALRVGIATAKGLSMALGIPTVGVNTLDIEAFPYRKIGIPVYAMIEAGRNQVAVAKYVSHKEAINSIEPWVATIEDLIESLQGKAIFCGEGSILKKEAFTDKSNGMVLWVSANNPTRRASILAHLGNQISIDSLKDTSQLEPIYVRGPSITKSKKWKS